MATVDSPLEPQEALAYVSDLAHAPEWDPAVRSVERLPGEPAEFALVARVAGRELPLRYTVVEHDPSHHAVLEARTTNCRLRDTITVGATSPGSRVRYDAEVSLAGWRRLLDPLLQFALTRVGDQAAAGLRRALAP